MLSKLLKYFCFIFLFILLTILSQIGGVVLVVSIFLGRRLKLKNWWKHVGLFIALYVASTFFIVPLLAKMNGRIALPLSNKNKVIPSHFTTCLLNRHYVKPRLYKLIHEVASEINADRKTEIKIRYLDANFPFWDGFPLLPHRSHDDGEKLDIAFLYLDKTTQQYWDKRVSILGYGFCEEPKKGESNMPQQCANKGYWQYSLLKQIFSPNLPNIQFDNSANTKLLKAISKHPSTKKIFIEPHLKSRLGFSGDHKIRFHGCAAVRHDDHIHIEL